MGLGLLRSLSFKTSKVFLAGSVLLISACTPLVAVVNTNTGTKNQSAESAYCTSRPTYSGGITVTGLAQFQYRPVNVNTGLDGNPVTENIPVAEIQVTNSAGTVVQCSETLADGTFSLVIPGGVAGTYTLSVFSRAQNTSLNASVLEDFYANQPYSISKSFSVTAVQTTAAIGTLTAYARSVDSAKIEGGAFNILFQLWHANQYLKNSATGFTVAPKVSVYWRKGYNPYNYFGSSSLLSFYRTGSRQLFILGGDGGAVNNVDTDHFDNSVVLHEYGHFLEDVYGKSDSPGGSHSGNFVIDPRLAWSEGWANFFQAAVQRYYDSTWKYYIDTVGFKNDSVESGSGYLSFKVELTIPGTSSGICASTPAAFSSIKCDQVGTSGEGTFREMSISRYLFKTIISVGSGGANIPFSAIWSVFSGADVSSVPTGFASSQVAFRNIGQFNQFFASIIATSYSSSTTDWNNVLSDEKQNSTAHDYGDTLSRVTENSCTAISLHPTIDLNNGSTHSNLLTSNDFYRFDYDGTTPTVLRLEYTGGSSNMDLDLFVYRESYLYQESAASDNGTIIASSAQAWATENGLEVVSMSGKPAGRYLINIKAYTQGKITAQLSGTASYRLKSVRNGTTTEDLCPAH